MRQRLVANGRSQTNRGIGHKDLRLSAFRLPLSPTIMERELVQFDLLIRGGTVVDGSGAAPGRPADVGIVGDRITATGAIGDATAGTVIEAAGKIVSPGF